MKNYKRKLTHSAELLDEYLRKYSRCRKHKELLERKKGQIKKDFDSPLRAIQMDGIPKSNGNNVGCAALSYELSEIETRIDEKIEEMKKRYVEIDSLIKFLPDDSIERAIMEYKYLLCYGWHRICEIEHLTRTPATEYWRRGLYKLLEFAKVQEVVREYEKTLNNQTGV